MFEGSELLNNFCDISTRCFENVQLLVKIAPKQLKELTEIYK